MNTKEATKHMGKRVVVTKKYIVIKDYSSINAKRITEVKSIDPRGGWFIGLKYIRNGVIERDYDYGHIFITKSVVVAALIAFWPLEKPVAVPFDGFEFDSSVEPYCSFGCGSGKYRSKNLDAMKRGVKNWPRDNKGRWIKG